MAPAGTAAGAFLPQIRTRMPYVSRGEQRASSRGTILGRSSRWSTCHADRNRLLAVQPDQHVCCYRDGEIYIELVTVAGE